MNEKIHVDADWRSLFHFGEELCGDRVMIRQSDDCFVLVLADGLGSGVKANILSTLTGTIISEMIFEGLSLDEAVETIAATLPVCSEREVAYSTFTILQVFYDGHAHLAQYDNPAAVFLRSGEVMPIRKEERRISGKTIYTSDLELKPGDHILIFSDGILYAGTEQELNYGWDQNAVEAFLADEIRPEDPAREADRILLAMVNNLYGGKPYDDCTVADVHIVPAEETVVMAGPPAHREDDDKVMMKLMNATRYKIVCGGTTSLVAARYLHTEVLTDTDSPMSEDVPPKAMIKGIDLVTEGLLTMQKANMFLRLASQDHDFYEELLLSKEQDGASCLVRALGNSSRIRFLLGMSENEGHKGFGSSISLSAKQMVIEEMADNLRRLGKIVTIEQY